MAKPKPCPSGKVRHKSEAEAVAAMELHTAQVVHIAGLGIGGRPGVYRCWQCSDWHWGHSWRR